MSRRSDCLVPGNCTANNVCYHCKVVRGDNQQSEDYIGQTSQKIKVRIGQHLCNAQKFHPVNNKAGMSKLSQHIGGLIFNNIPWSWEWQIICQTQNYSPISNRCDLCLNEKYYIMYHNEYASLNMKSELFGYCRHKESHLLLKVKTWPYEDILLLHNL